MAFTTVEENQTEKKVIKKAFKKRISECLFRVAGPGIEPGTS